MKNGYDKKETGDDDPEMMELENTIESTSRPLEVPDERFFLFQE